MTDPNVNPKIYAPLLSQLETEHPQLAPRLVGIGDDVCEFDAGKRKVRAHFQTEAGTAFSGRYITRADTASDDARAFLAAMAKKFAAVTQADRKVLAEEPSPPTLTETVYVDSPDGPAPVEEPISAPVSELLEDDDPEPATPPESEDEGAEDADWGKPTQ